MRLYRWHCALAALLALGAANAAGADLKTEYERRVAERFAASFQSLDLNRDGTVSRDEAHGDLNFLPRFNDMDINRDGIVTAAELQRFLALEFGVSVELARK
jgi:Ca2+-binding EF-hand superfamily protein